MYDVPSDHTIEKVTITSETISDCNKAKLSYDSNRKPINISISEKNNKQNFSAS